MDRAVNLLLILEPDFPLGGMDVNVYPIGCKIYEENGNGVAIRGDESPISVENRTINSPIPYEASIYISEDGLGR